MHTDAYGRWPKKTGTKEKVCSILIGKKQGKSAIDLCTRPSGSRFLDEIPFIDCFI